MPSMPIEMELKFSLEDFSAVRKALRAAGAEHLGTFLQTDRYFETSAGSLRKSDRCLRIRSVQRLGGSKVKGDVRPLLTFKGPRRPSRRLKIRPEIQTHLEDADTAAEILRACGLRPAMTIQKRRTSYRLGRCRVELDELPLIGCFVEIEAPDEKAIRSACRKLALSGEPITTPYTDMLRAYCRRKRISSRNVTFK